MPFNNQGGEMNQEAREWTIRLLINHEMILKSMSCDKAELVNV
jgi:hypothetical protein